MRDRDEGDIVRFVHVHHAMNPGLKGHEGDKAEVVDVNRGYGGNKVLIDFIEGSSAAVIDRWTVKPSRLEILKCD